MQSIDPEFLTNAIREATSSVFATMLDSDVEMITGTVLEEEVEGGVVSLVGITGAWTGSGSVACTPPIAGLIAHRMLMADGPDCSVITEEIMDAVAELTNMIVGNIKNTLEERFGTLAISIPTVIFGRNFQVKSVTGSSGLRIPFAWEGGRVDVRVSLAPVLERHSAARLRGDQPAAA